jgi:hypothetical protein
MTAPAEEWTSQRPLWGSLNGLGYALLLFMMSVQKPGGLVTATHDQLGHGLALERGMVSRAMTHLVAARLVTVLRRGQFQMHPAISAFDSQKEQLQAMRALPREMRLDEGDFEDEYERRLELHQKEKARKAEQRKVTDITRPRLTSVPPSAG